MPFRKVFRYSELILNPNGVEMFKSSSLPYRLIPCSITLIIALLPALVHASGESVYAQQCAVCHGAEAQGNDAMSSPRLAGQSQTYLQRQLKHFKSGVRGKADGDSTGRQMVAIAAGLDESAVVSVSEYLAALPASFSAEGIEGDLHSGSKLYQSYCGSCHGSDAVGNEMLNAPNLRMLSSQYFKAQYQKFLNGQRGHDRTDKYGRQMKMMAAAMSETEQIEAVAAYLQSLKAE